MRRYLSKILLTFMLFVGISLCVTDYAQATIEESKLIEIESPSGNYTEKAPLPEPGTIYRVDWGTNVWGGSRPYYTMRIWGTHNNVSNHEAYVNSNRYGELSDTGGWVSLITHPNTNLAYHTGTLDYVNSGMNCYFINSNETETHHRFYAKLHYYTYTLTPSEYSYSIVKDPNDKNKMYIKIDWNMIDEPANIQYRVHNKTTNQYSGWITGDGGSYSWTDYNIHVGTQYNYEITFRQFCTNGDWLNPISEYIYKTVSIGSYTINPLVESLKEIKEIITNEEYGNEALGNKITNINNKLESLQSPIILSVKGHNGATATKGNAFAVDVTAANATYYRAGVNGNYTEWQSSPRIDNILLPNNGVNTIEVQAKRSNADDAPAASGYLTVFKLN